VIMEASLIKQEENQLRLISESALDQDIFKESENSRNPEFTAERLFKHRPDKYQAIVALSAEIGAIRLADMLHVSVNSVLAVRRRESEAIHEEKKRISIMARDAARMCVEAIIEMLADPDTRKKISVRELGIVHGILIDKSELLGGSPTSRVSIQNINATVDMSDYLKILHEQSQRVAQAKLIEPEKDQ